MLLRRAPWWALLVTSAAFAQAPAWRPPAAQKLSFEAEWRLVHAGDVEVESSAAESLKMQLRTAGVVRAFIKVDNQFQASYSPGWCAQATELIAHEGKRHRETKVRYDTEARKAHYLERDLEKDTVVAQNNIDIPACVHDVTAGLQRLRELLPQPGSVTELPLSDGKKVVMARVEAQLRERIRTPVGEFQTIRYEAFLMSGVLYRRKGRLFVWISEDERRLPVQIRVQMPFYIGTVTLQLEKVE
ncbi:MAG: DUF3108 domain-containing protein [Acidobacteriota bacterium]